MKTIATLMATAAIATTAALPVFAETWDMPLAYSATNFHSENAAKFGECVTSGTEGAIEIVTHPSGSLFKGADIKRAVQTGQVNIGERLLSGHQNENILFGFDSIPFLATSFEDSVKLYGAARPKIEEILADQNLTLLYAVPWPPQGLYFRDAVNSIEEMEGIKFRSYNIATARLAALTGMLPVQIEAAEISQAFATGVADAMISSGATGYDRKVWESLGYFYEVDAWLPRNYVMVNSDAWNGLDEATQQVFTDCAATAEAEGLEASIAYTNFTLDGLREGGMTVEKASDTMVEGLKAVGETMTSEWLDAAGDDGAAIVDAFKASQ